MTDLVQLFADYGMTAVAAIAVSLLVWFIRSDRKDRRDERDKADLTRQEELSRSEKRFDRLIESNTMSKQVIEAMMEHVNQMHQRGTELAEKVISSVGPINTRLDDIADNVNAVHTRFDNHIGGRSLVRGTKDA